MPRNLPIASESNEQAAFVDTVLQVYRNRADFVRLLFFSTLSGGRIAGSTREAKIRLIAKYKREGWVNGVADILYLQPRGEFAFLAIEMKTPARQKEKNGGASKDQIEWLKAAKEAGAMTAICHGRDAAWDVFTRYMELPCPEPSLSE